MGLFNRNLFDTHVKNVAYLLNEGKSITSIEAIKKFGCTRLSAVIFELKRKGLDIESIRETTTNSNGHTVSYVRYRIRR